MARGAAAAGTVMCLSTLATVASRRSRRLLPTECAGSSSTGAPTARRCRTSSTGPLPPATARSWSRSTCRWSAAASATCERASRRPASLSDVTDNSLTWRDLEWLRSHTSLPILVKGILTAEDAVLASEAGVDGIVVSNHGGRQLDGVAASLDALPEVVEAAGDRAEVLLDGGVRRGTDVVKALALGARAVLVGRAAL